MKPEYNMLLDQNRRRKVCFPVFVCVEFSECEKSQMIITNLKLALTEKPVLFMLLFSPLDFHCDRKKLFSQDNTTIGREIDVKKMKGGIFLSNHLKPVACQAIRRDTDTCLDQLHVFLPEIQIRYSLEGNLHQMLSIQRVTCDGIPSERQFKKKFLDFLVLRPQLTAAEILGYLMRTMHSGAAFARLVSRSCYFGYAPVLEAEVSYRDFFPAISSWSSGPFTIDIGRGAAPAQSWHRQEESSVIRTLDSLLSGAVSGALSRTCTAPLDRLKVMRQVHGYQHAGSSALAAFRWMLREGGPRSLWRGNGVSVLKIAPETAVKYTAYGFYKDLVATALQRPSKADASHSAVEHHHQLPLYEKFLAGSMAGATSQSLIYPLEVVKTRMCLRKTGQYGGGGIANCLATVYSDGGFRALYRGYSVTLVGILPYAGIELATYETARAQLQGVPGGALVSGALASSLGIVTCYPLALMRAKLQAKVRFTRPELNTVRGLAAAIYQAEGPAGFYRGMGANLTKVLPSVAISFAVFERLNLYLHFGHALGSE